MGTKRLCHGSVRLLALGASGVDSSAGEGIMLTSSNSPMLYTLSMSACACFMLYTCSAQHGQLGTVWFFS